MTEITSKPKHGSLLIESGKALRRFQLYLDDITRLLNTIVGAQVTLPSYTVLTLPPVIDAPGLIFVSDETGGAIPAFSDGTNWRRVTDRAIVS